MSNDGQQGRGPGGIGAQLQQAVRGPAAPRPPAQTIKISNEIYAKFLAAIDQQPLDCALNATNNLLCMLAIQARLPMEFVLQQTAAGYQAFLEEAQKQAQAEPPSRLIIPGR